MNVLEPFIEQARSNPQRSAIITANEEISFDQLDLQSSSLARSFQKQGLKKGDIVLVVRSVDIDLYKTLLALFRMGAVAMFPDASAGLKNIGISAEFLNVRGFSGGWKARILKVILPQLWKIPLVLQQRNLVASERGDVESLPAEYPALITFTSGSTGKPKGIVRTHDFLMCQHDMVTRMLLPQENDVDLISLPIFVLSNLASGVTSVIPDGDLRYPARMAPAPMIEQIKKHGVNRILAPPALCDVLAGSGEVCPQIKKIFTGGGPVFPTLLQKLSVFAPEAQITAAYGSTEAEPIAHVALADISADDFSAMESGEGLLTGAPVKGIEVRILDDEIIVTGDHVIKTYIDPSDDKSTKIRMGGRIWHKTGDAGRMDARGRLWLLGRVEARQGSVYPFCIETAARSIEGIRHAAFLKHGTKTILAIEADSISDKLEMLKARFGAFEVVRLDSMPLDRRHNSKIDYGHLRQILDDV